jgi:hypothetical protein
VKRLLLSHTKEIDFPSCISRIDEKLFKLYTFFHRKHTSQHNIMLLHKDNGARIIRNIILRHLLKQNRIQNKMKVPFPVGYRCRTLMTPKRRRQPFGNRKTTYEPFWTDDICTSPVLRNAWTSALKIPSL